MILVTGATGFIGRAVVARLLAARRPLVVIARSRAGEPARSRVAAALGDAAGPAGVEVVEGDLARHGLAAADLRRLRATVETVIHCAGDTSFTPAALAPYYRAYLAQDVRFDDRAAAAVLGRCGLPRPRLTTSDVHRLVDLALAGNRASRGTTLASVE